MVAAVIGICPNLGTATNFVVIAGNSVTNVDNTVITGNLSISPGTTLTGFNPPGVITGITLLGTAIAQQAQNDTITAYNQLAGANLTATMTGTDLGGLTLGPGVYKFASTAGISAGILTLNGSGIYIFQIGTGITTATGTQVLLTNGASASCVYWQIGSSATLGSNSYFAGNILAYASIWLVTGVTVDGGLYARTGDVTLISNIVNSVAVCNAC
jgi:hypothetical protein